jgi:hypothetical protein
MSREPPKTQSSAILEAVQADRDLCLELSNLVDKLQRGGITPAAANKVTARAGTIIKSARARLRLAKGL